MDQLPFALAVMAALYAWGQLGQARAENRRLRDRLEKLEPSD